LIIRGYPCSSVVSVCFLSNHEEHEGHEEGDFEKLLSIAIFSFFVSFVVIYKIQTPMQLNQKSKIKNQKFYNSVLKTVRQLDMLTPNDRVLIAVSGGSDSVALLLVLNFLKSQFSLSLGIAHLNHQLRGEDSQKDEVFVKELAQNFGFEFFSDQKDVKAHAKDRGLSLEEAGRKLRYEFFLQVAQAHGFQKIATGHNKNDNAELVLMNLLRGSGLKGLSGIPPLRQGLYIRPLIRMSKEEILDFLACENQAFRTDASNADMDFLRNAIRQRLIPQLEQEYNPSIVNTLNRLSSIVSQDEDFLEIETENYFNLCLIQMEESFVSLSIKALIRLHPAMQYRVLRKAIKKVKKDLRRISLVHLESIFAFCFEKGSKSSLGGSLDLPDRIRIYKKGGEMVVRKEERALREIGKRKITKENRKGDDDSD
jgi:tRNA(Ile)-lysidine synthase